jgi:hypothetical protein
VAALQGKLETAKLPRLALHLAGGVVRWACLALGASVASVTHTGVIGNVAYPAAVGGVAARVRDTESHATRGDASRVGLAVEAAEARIAHTVGVDVTLATPVAAVAADLGGAIPQTTRGAAGAGLAIGAREAIVATAGTVLVAVAAAIGGVAGPVGFAHPKAGRRDACAAWEEEEDDERVEDNDVHMVIEKK